MCRVLDLDVGIWCSRVELGAARQLLYKVRSRLHRIDQSNLLGDNIFQNIILYIR